MARGNDNIEGLAGLLSAVLTQHTIIQAADNAVDGKAHNLMAAALVVVPLLGTQLRAENGEWQWLTVIAMAILLVVISMVIYMTRNREYAGAVVDLREYPDYFSKDDGLLLVQLTEDADLANDYNTQILLEKQNWFRWSVLIFLTGLTLGVISLFRA